MRDAPPRELPRWSRPRAWLLRRGILAKLGLSLIILIALPTAGAYLVASQPGSFWLPGFVLAVTGLTMGVQLTIIRHHLIKPLRSLTNAAQALKAGNYDAPIPNTTLDETGQLVAAFDAMRKELRLAIRNARENQREWETIFNTIQEEVYLISKDCRVVRANHAAARRVGEPLETIVGSPCHRICPAGAAFSTGGCPGLTVLANRASTPMEVRDPQSGQTLIFSVYPLRNERNELQAYVEVIQDVTPLKQAEAEASKRETLRLLGEMAAGVAHDLNNTLAIVLGYTERAIGGVNDRPEVLQSLETAKTAARRGGETVRRIATFARVQQQRGEQSPVTLDTLVEECVTLSQHKFQDEALKGGGVIQAQTALEPAAILGNAAELTEILLNLIFNAVDAMPLGGTLTLKTFRDGDSAVIEVEDTGVGMSQEVSARAFDPFFTTKGDKGTGLGLSIVRTIVDQHRGRIEVESAPGRGTTVRIRFRLTDQPIPSRAAPPASFSLPGLVLLVEDEEEIRALLRDILRREGHMVLEASTGIEALKLFDQGSFDLIVTDLAMPGLSGLEVIKAARDRNPETPAILVTGYAELLDPESAQLPTRVLAKPFTFDQVRQAVRSVLAESSHSPLKFPPSRADT